MFRYFINILFVIFFIGSTNLYLGLPDGKYIMPICAKGSALYIESYVLLFFYCTNVFLFLCFILMIFSMITIIDVHAFCLCLTYRYNFYLIFLFDNG